MPCKRPDITYDSYQKNTWSELGLHNYSKILIIAALFCCLFRQEIQPIIQRWFTDPSWSHGLLIPFFSLYLLNRNKTNILNLRTKPAFLGLFFILAVLLFYVLNIVHFQYGYFRPLAVIACMGAIILFLGGWHLVKFTWLPVAFLIFAVPLPPTYYVKLTMPMRQLAAMVASVLLNMVKGMEATAHGVIIDVIYKGRPLEPALDVAEACSGMRLLMAFVALGVAMAYLHYRPVWQRIILLAATVPIAIFCNIIRVTVTGFIYILGDPKYAQGIYHDLLGLVMLPLAFALYGFLAWFMSDLIVEETAADQPEQIVISKRQNKR